MSSTDPRPRVAIVGGGGAMGRLFGRLLRDAARELYLIDYFGTGARPASLGLTLDEIRPSDATGSWTVNGVMQDPGESAGGQPGATSWRLSEFQPHGQRAFVGVSAGATKGMAPLVELTGAATIVELLCAHAPSDPECGLVFAGQPSDAADLLPRADVVVLALGFESRSSFADTIRPYARWVKAGSLVVDLGSTKTQPLAVLGELLPNTVDVLGAHPLFGPTVADLTGLIVAVVDPVDRRTTTVWRGWFLDQLARHRMLVTRTSVAEHDDAMAFVQALTHFALLSFAYTFVRLDRDPADLLPYRTPIFEPLLYLAARVAYLAGSTPDTYRSIQAFSTRPDARQEFLDAAREILGAIERLPTDEKTRLAHSLPDPLTELFRRSGGPWSPDDRDRRDRQRREHFVDMGGRLVDGLNQLRQEIVASVGQVRAIEEKRSGQPPRIVVGVVDLDLRDPRKYDVASQIRLKRLNLALGSVKGEVTSVGRPVEGSQDVIVPVARARLLGDDELYEWLYQTNQLVERRAIPLVVPAWFDRDVLARLVRGTTAPGQPRGGLVWDVTIEVQPLDVTLPPGMILAKVTIAIVLPPAEIVAMRQAVQSAGHDQFTRELTEVENELKDLRSRIAAEVSGGDRGSLEGKKDVLKHARKALVDRRTADVDREVRRATRARVGEIRDAAIDWLLAHGCARPVGVD